VTGSSLTLLTQLLWSLRANKSVWTKDLIGQVSSRAPALAVWNDTLYLAFVTNNSGILLLSSQDGKTWTKDLIRQASSQAPALAVWNNTLYLAFVANDIATNTLLLVSSRDGKTWTDNQPIQYNSGNSFTNLLPQVSLQAPALAVWNDTLYLAFVDEGIHNNLLLVASRDGKTWTDNQPIQYNSGNFFTNLLPQVSLQAPALAVWNDTLYLAFVNNDSSILLASSRDGKTWTDNQPIGDVGFASSQAPALAAWNNTLHLAFVDNDSTNNLLLISLKK